MADDVMWSGRQRVNEKEGSHTTVGRVDPAPRPLSSNAMLFQDGANQRRCDGDQGWV